MLIAIHKRLKELEERIETYQTKKIEIIITKNDKIILNTTRVIVKELKLLIKYIEQENNNPEKNEIIINIKEIPILQHLINIIGPNDVFAWIKEEIRKEIKKDRERRSKLIDNDITTAILRKIKNKTCWQTLDIKPKHGSSVSWECGEPTYRYSSDDTP